MPSKNSNREYIKALAKKIVESSSYDQDSNTLFVTNPGISAQLLKSLAKKQGFRIGQVKTGEYISIPLNYRQEDLDDKYISQFDNFLDTYTNFNKNYHTLLTAYKTFDLMEENLGEVDLILSTYVEEVLSTGFVDDPLKIKISNPDAQKIVDAVLYKNKFFARLPMIVRNIAKYGNMGFTLSYPYLMTEYDEIDANVEEHKIDVVKDLVITPVNPKFFKVTCDNWYNVINYQTQIDNTYSYTNNLVSVQNLTWQPWQFQHFLIYSEITEPYGQSMLWSMRSSFDQLTTLEALLAVSRASKVQRLVISIPIPVGASQMDAYQYLNEFKANYLSSLFTDAPGTKAGRKIPGATSIFVKPAIKDFTIDKIDSNIDLSSTEDVEYFLDKILRNSKLPKGYLVGDDTITTAQTLESQDLKLSRALVPLKKALVDGTLGLVEKILVHAGFDVSKINVEVTLNKPIQISNDLIAKYNDIIQLIGNVQEVINPKMTNINRYQLLVEMGIPVNAARLMCSKSSISTLENAADLKKFMLGQKEQEPQSVEQIPDAGSMEECTKVDVMKTSKQFLKENVDLAEDLNDFYNIIKSESKSGKKSLHESLIKPKITEKEEETQE